MERALLSVTSLFRWDKWSPRTNPRSTTTGSASLALLQQFPVLLTVTCPLLVFADSLRGACKIIYEDRLAFWSTLSSAGVKGSCNWRRSSAPIPPAANTCATQQSNQSLPLEHSEPGPAPAGWKSLNSGWKCRRDSAAFPPPLCLEKISLPYYLTFSLPSNLLFALHRESPSLWHKPPPLPSFSLSPLYFGKTRVFQAPSWSISEEFPAVVWAL